MGTGSKRDYKECSPSRVAKYRGLRKPRCNGGDGCSRCWLKYDSAEGRAARHDRIAARRFGEP